MEDASRRARPEKKFGTLAAAAIAGFLAHAEPTQSAEIPPTASWSQGINILHEEVVLGKEETVVWYLKGNANSWLAPATTGSADLRLYDSNPAENLPPNNSINVVCEFHDHVLETFLRAQQEGHAPPDPSPQSIITFQEQFKQDSKTQPPPVDAPPSRGDISIDRHLQLLSQIQDRLGPSVKLEHGVKTVQGIWYFSPTTSALEHPELLNVPFIRLSGEARISPPIAIPLEETVLKYIEALGTGANVEEARARVIDAYRYIGSNVRLVPNNQIDKEPECAGADYAAP